MNPPVFLSLTQSCISTVFLFVFLLQKLKTSDVEALCLFVVICIDVRHWLFVCVFIPKVFN